MTTSSLVVDVPQASGSLQQDTETEAPRVLVVDDDPAILRAIRRTLSARDFELVTAPNGEEAIAQLAANPVAVLISDQNMPGLSGSMLLQHARQHHPTTVRIMLTGNHDLATALEAINQGAVFRFLHKPWEHEEFLRVVDSALEHHELLESSKRYERFVEEQNQKLKTLNEDLELRVVERTAALLARQEQVRLLYAELQESFDATIRAVLCIMELGEIRVVEHGQRTAERIRQLADRLDVPAEIRRDLERAALLHWLGLINAPASMFAKATDAFDAVEQASWEFHPLLGQQAIGHVPALKRAGDIILHYQRPYNDPGFTSGALMEGERGLFDPALVRACHVLHVASSFELVRTRLRHMGMRELPEHMLEALDALQARSGTLLDPAVVDVFCDTVRRQLVGAATEEVRLELRELAADMTLSRPVETTQGILVAPRDMVVTEELIDRLWRFQGSCGLAEIHVWQDVAGKPKAP